LIDTISSGKDAEKSILLPEGSEERTVQAVALIPAQGIAEVTLLGNTDEIRVKTPQKFNVSLDAFLS
jgi:phosphotransacetylase